MTTLGARLADGSCTFTVWAPGRGSVGIHLVEPRDSVLPLERDSDGLWTATFADVPAGSLYFVRLDGELDRPDPASASQPRGVHGPSRVVDFASFAWTDRSFLAPESADQIIYELHVGAFTPEGTFASAIDRLPHLVDLGITTIELMPLSAYPGTRNWGYDGAHPFAVQESLGGPEGLFAFVDASHRAGLAVMLDVVYNHLGPEGNYLRDFGPYFTDRYRTPWGDALNFDGPDSEGVVRHFVQNAFHWLDRFHIDGLRFDAVHAIVDRGARPFLQRLTDSVHKSPPRGRIPFLVAESDLNDTRVLAPSSQGGLGFHAQWSDDFHHALHALLTGERLGYYEDFGSLDELAAVFERSWLHRGEYSRHRRRCHGNDASSYPTGAFVVCDQNHDQIGNRMLGERLLALTDIPRARLALATTLLSPFVPMLFMGEEFAERRPFLYFIDHGDELLRQAVSRGRREEFAAFHAEGVPPDPSSASTFESSILDWDAMARPEGARMRDFCRRLIALRRDSPALRPGERNRFAVHRPHPDVLELRYEHPARPLVVLLRFAPTSCELPWTDPADWTTLLATDASGTDIANATIRLEPWGVLALEPHRRDTTASRIPSGDRA